MSMDDLPIIPEPKEKDKRAWNLIAGSIIIAAEGLILIQLIYYACITFPKKKRTIYNHVQLTMFITTITARLACLIATIILDDSKDIDVFDL